MSWQVATFVVLALVLGGGVAWYERGRPPAQVVALVAALAALAVAGRLVLAPIPNAVATTDIVLIAGYALGPAPGFMVGALAGLVSNLWLGQGPWTPWQMTAWGMTGIAGAGLATFFTHRRIGRIPLAVACGVAGIGFGVLMNFSTMATYGGEMSLGRYLALQARALPFDLTHAAGNFVLALIAGPAMIRMLTRFRDRFRWRYTPLAGLVVIATLGLAVLPGQARAADLEAAVGWMGSVQNADGGFGPSPGDDSSIVTTSWAILGLAAAGVNAHDLPGRSGASPVDFLRQNAAKVKSTGDIARTILALNAAGVEPRKFAGRNLIAELHKRRRADGSWEEWPNSTAIAVIALRQSGATGGLRKSLDWLRDSQGEDGGWGARVGAPSDPDSTGTVLQALGGDRTVKRAVAYLRGVQRPSGGTPLTPGSAPNTQSTAWAMQGLLSVGINPKGFRAGGDKSAHEFLTAMQTPDGHFRYSAGNDKTPTWVTAQALVAAAGKWFPVAAPPRKPKPKPKPAPQPAPAPTPPVASPPPAPPPAQPAPLPSSPPSSGVSPGSVGGGSSPGGGSAPDATTVKPRPIDPGAFDEPTGPDSPVTSPAPGAPDEPDAGDATTPPPPGAEAGEQRAAPAKRPAPSPAAPAGIGLGLAGLTAGGMWLLGRRRGW